MENVEWEDKWNELKESQSLAILSAYRFEYGITPAQNIEATKSLLSVLMDMDARPSLVSAKYQRDGRIEKFHCFVVWCSDSVDSWTRRLEEVAKENRQDYIFRMFKDNSLGDLVSLHDGKVKSSSKTPMHYFHHAVPGWDYQSSKITLYPKGGGSPMENIMRNAIMVKSYGTVLHAVG